MNPLRLFFDGLLGRLWRLDGDLVPFTDLPETWPVPDLTLDGKAAGKSATPGGGDVRTPQEPATRAPGSNPGDVGAASTDRLEGGQGVGFPQALDFWPVGAGRRANDCRFLDDPRHACLNSYGEPIRPGQSCFHSARLESLRSFADAHPKSWLTKAIAPDLEAVRS